MNSLDEFVREKLHTDNKALIMDSVRSLEYHRYKKGDCILESGEEIPAIYFLVSDGVLRSVYHTVNGKEITDSVYCGWGTCAMPGSDLSKPSRVELEALTDVRLLELPLAKLHRLEQKYPEARCIMRDAAEEYWKRQLELKRVRYERDAAGRYRWFCQTYPEAVGRMMIKHIATFLDMTPVQLSRIRRQLAEKQTALSVQ